MMMLWQMLKSRGVEIKEGKDGNTIVTGEREKVKEFYHQLLDPEEKKILIQNLNLVLLIIKKKRVQKQLRNIM